MSIPRCTVCIPAAGSGSRMQMDEPKQYLPLLDIPILIHSVRAFHRLDTCDRVIVATDDAARMQSLLQKYSLEKKIEIVEGGTTRAESVWNCLQRVDDEALVLIHDAARPCVTREEIESVVHAVAQYGAAVLAFPARDTIKRAEGNFVKETVDRSTIFLAQTPQGATATLFKKAFQFVREHALAITDDVQALEAIGVSVRIVEGKTTNIKVTTQDDLWIAGEILKRR